MDRDAYLAEDDREYSAAECEKPHENGDKCLPSWDGYGYVCVDRILREREAKTVS